MYHLTVSPDTYEVRRDTRHQNPLIQETPVNAAQASRQHAHLRSLLPKTISIDVTSRHSLPDLVYIASAGLSLPGLPDSVVILPRMKYASRRAELPVVKTIFQKLGVKMIELPRGIVFEGEAEAVWLQEGRVLLHGYGYRSTKATGPALQKLLTAIYTQYAVPPPTVVSVSLQSPETYHIDMALLVVSPSFCIARQGAFSEAGRALLTKLFKTVRVVSSSDPFALNAIVLEKTILTHKPLDPAVKEILEEASGKSVTEVNVSEFEKGGGAVACLVMEMYEPTQNSSQ